MAGFAVELPFLGVAVAFIDDTVNVLRIGCDRGLVSGGAIDFLRNMKISYFKSIE